MQAFASSLRRLLRAAFLLGLACGTVAWAGTVAGTASWRERIALPPGAVFEAVLKEPVRPDAPALVLGRSRVDPVAVPPVRFVIDYDAADVQPGRRYVVVGQVVHAGRVWFAGTSGPLRLDGTDAPVLLRLAASASPDLGRLPASFGGELPGASGPVHWQLDLLPRGRFQLRLTYVGQPEPNRFDDIGRAVFDRPGGRLMLTGSTGTVTHLELTADGNLRKLDSAGRPIDSMHLHLLRRLDMPALIEPRLALTGWFTYMADAASIELCADGSRLPVAMEGDYLALERAYTATRRNPGQAEIVAVQGVIASRPAAEPGQPPRPTLVVERFDGLRPGIKCRGASLDAAAPPRR